MNKTRFKGSASAAIHSAASGLHLAKLIDKKTMREYNALCIELASEPVAEPDRSPSPDSDAPTEGD